MITISGCFEFSGCFWPKKYIYACSIVVVNNRCILSSVYEELNEIIWSDTQNKLFSSNYSHDSLNYNTVILRVQFGIFHTALV
jgi:glycogen synthase